MTQAELSKAVEEIWEMFRETRRNFQETDKKFQETDKKFQETDKKFQKTDRYLKELSRQIGGLGDKFGGFTEGMAFPSMKRILMKKFGVECISVNILVRKNGDEFEADVMGYSGGEPGRVYLVEVKSNFKNEHLERLLDNLRRFPNFFPEHRNKELYGILAAVEINEYNRKRVSDARIYLALIRNNMFCLKISKDFKSKNFNRVL